MRAEKQLLLDEIKEKLQRCTALVVTRYQNMDPNLASTFRGKLLKSGGGFAVMRKRLLMKAAEGKGISLDRQNLQGHIGVIFAYEDPIQITKTVYDFSKANENVLEVLGGHFEGQFYSAQDVKMLSELPSKDEMRAQLLGLFEAPMAQSLAVMEALMTSILYCLENKSKQEI